MKNYNPDEHTIILDPQEQEIEDAFESGSLTTIPNFEEEKKRYQKIAANSAKQRKNKMISLRISEADLADIQTVANQRRLPYQTYIISIVHQHTQSELRKLRKQE